MQIDLSLKLENGSEREGNEHGQQEEEAVEGAHVADAEQEGNAKKKENPKEEEGHSTKEKAIGGNLVTDEVSMADSIISLLSFFPPLFSVQYLLKF